MNDRARTATAEGPATPGVTPSTQAETATGAGVTGWGVGAAQGGAAGTFAGGTVGAAGGGLIGWGIGMAGGAILGLICGMFLGLTIARGPYSRP